MSPLTDILPAQVRRILYAVYALVGLCFGAIQIGFSAGSLYQPVWLIVAWAVFGFVGTGLGLTAASNITSLSSVVETVTPDGTHIAGPASPLPTGSILPTPEPPIITRGSSNVGPLAPTD